MALPCVLLKTLHNDAKLSSLMSGAKPEAVWDGEKLRRRANDIEKNILTLNRYRINA